jgi:hypothetical protein
MTSADPLKIAKQDLGKGSAIGLARFPSTRRTVSRSRLRRHRQ